MTRVAVVAPNTLLGRELRERLAARPGLASEARLLSADEEEIGQLAESGGAASFVGRLDDDAFAGIDLAFFCGSIETDRRWIEGLPAEVRAIVLSRGATTADAEPAIAGAGRKVSMAQSLLVPHPAAYGAALLLSRLARLPLRSAQAVAVLPVSTHDEAGLESLFEQTRAILAFQSPKRGPLRRQIAFNVGLAEVDADAVAEQVRSCLDLDYPVAMELLEGGIFHGVGLSLRVESREPIAPRELRRALTGDPRIEIARKPASVSPVALAGSEQLTIGEIRPAGGPDACWIWAAFDNLTRAGALAALELAEELLGSGSAPS